MVVAGVKELKNELSAYLREVKNGEIVLITNHDRVVAELRAPTVTGIGLGDSSRKADWLKEGDLRAPSNKLMPLEKSPVNVPDGTVAQLLDFGRGE